LDPEGFKQNSVSIFQIIAEIRAFETSEVTNPATQSYSFIFR
jgi:hypothetical protein